ncbi:MAG: hypothetical protein QOK35_2198, partial [Pseudonocardiales bacterium]|nr:hypothetical protein [Pseudonocardiales bacterium]
GAALAVAEAAVPAAAVPAAAVPAADPATVRLGVPRRVVSLEEVTAGPDQGLSSPVGVEPARAPEPSLPIWSLPVSSVPVESVRDAVAEPAVDVVPAVGPVAGAVDVAVGPEAVTRKMKAVVGQVGAGPAITEPVDEPVAETVDTEPKPRAVPVRTPAVFDAGSRHGPRSRSLPRLLLGAGAVAAAALVLVALFRPDGPLDPPLDPTAGVPRVTGAPVPGPQQATDAQAPAVGGFPGGGLPVDGAPAAVRMTEPLRPGRNDDRDRADRDGADRPVERAVERAAVDSADRSDGDRSPSDTGPAPDVRVTGPGPAGHSMAAQLDDRPVGAATRVPPTPAPPRA